MTRQQIESLINQNLPTNNNKEISALLLREVLFSLNDNKFNLDEDTLREQLYQIGQTLEQRLQGLPFERRAILGAYNFDASGIESLDVFSDPDNIIQTAIRNRISSRDMVFDVTFTENIVGKTIDCNWILPPSVNANLGSLRLEPGPVVKVLGDLTDFSRRFAQTRRITGGVGEYYFEVIIKG